MAKHYDQGSLKNFHLHFMSLVMIQISESSQALGKKIEKFIQIILTSHSWKLSKVSFLPKFNTQNNVYRKLWNLNLFCNLFALNPWERRIKSYEKYIKLSGRLGQVKSFLISYSSELFGNSFFKVTLKIVIRFPPWHLRIVDMLQLKRLH